MVTRTNRSQLLTEDEDLCRPIKENTYTHTHTHILCACRHKCSHAHTHTPARNQKNKQKNIFFVVVVINGDREYKNTLGTFSLRRPETAECLSNQVRERKSNLPKPYCGKARS